MRAPSRRKTLLLGYDPGLQGGVVGVLESLVQQCPDEFRLHPILGYYGRPFDSLVYTARSFARLLGQLVRRRIKHAVVVVGSRGDIARTIPFLWLLLVCGKRPILYFHKDLVNILAPGLYARLVTRLVWRRCAKAVFLSGGLAERAAREYGIPRGLIVVIPNGLPASWRGASALSHSARELDVAFFGRWSPEKGVDDLQRLFDQSRLGQRYTCHVFGAYREAGVTGSFEFHGWCDTGTVAGAMRKAAVVILPSYSEAYPTVLLEAAACGTPFVATDIAGIPDIARESGAGYAVPAGDVEAMERAVTRLLTDQQAWETASRQGHAWAQHQTVENMADQWLALLRQL